MLPQAAAGDGLLACSDGSLVSLFRLDGARSMVGAAELERFVELACRRLNSRLTEPGHALHLMLERAPDEAGPQVARIHARAGRQAARLGLDLGDVLDERTRCLGTLFAAETMVLACWTRPAVLMVAEVRRGRKKLRARLKSWLPAPGESQCPHAVLDGLEPRHRALLDTLGALFGEAGIAAERLDDEGALRTMRILLNGSDTTAADWRPVTAANDAPARVTEPPEAGAFPPPLALQLLVREPVSMGAGIRIGGRLYGALDMTLGPRASRPFAELMEGLAEAGLPCRFSILIEGGGLRRLGPAVARVAAAFMAFSHPDSRAVRDAMRALAEQDAGASAVVRLRLGLLTWVSPEEGEDTLARRLGRLQQLAEGWGECVFSPLVGDPLEAFAASVPGFCCGGTAEPALAPLSEALRLLPVCRPAPLARHRGTPWYAANHIFRAPDGKMLPWSCEEGEDHGFELIHGIPGRGKSVLMNSLTLAHVLQGGQARLPLAATIDIGPSSAGLISLIRESAAAGAPGRSGMVPAPHEHHACHQPLRHPARLPLSPPGRTRLPREPARPDPDPGGRSGRSRRHARAHRPHDLPRLSAPLRSHRGRRAQCLCRRPGRRRSTGRWSEPDCGPVTHPGGRWRTCSSTPATRSRRRAPSATRCRCLAISWPQSASRRCRVLVGDTVPRDGPRDGDAGLHPHRDRPCR